MTQGNPVLRQFSDFAALKAVTRFSAWDNANLRDFHGICKPFATAVITSVELSASARPSGCAAKINTWPLAYACASLCSCRRCFPPSLSSAQFRSSGRALDVTFTAPTDQAGVFSTSCSAIWTNAAATLGPGRRALLSLSLSLFHRVRFTDLCDNHHAQMPCARGKRTRR
jgi:hypothetical protein